MRFILLSFLVTVTAGVIHQPSSLCLKQASSESGLCANDGVIFGGRPLATVNQNAFVIDRLHGQRLYSLANGAKSVVKFEGKSIRRFMGGKATVETRENNGTIEQLVTIVENKGRIDSSLCSESDLGEYEDIVRFGVTVKQAALSGKLAAFEALVQYPLRVNRINFAGRSHDVQMVHNRTVFFHDHEDFVTPAMLRTLGQMTPEIVICKYDRVAFAYGAIWAWRDRSRHLKIGVINR